MMMMMTARRRRPRLCIASRGKMSVSVWHVTHRYSEVAQYSRQGCSIIHDCQSQQGARIVTLPSADEADTHHCFVPLY